MNKKKDKKKKKASNVNYSSGSMSIKKILHLCQHFIILVSGISSGYAVKMLAEVGSDN